MGRVGKRQPLSRRLLLWGVAAGCATLGVLCPPPCRAAPPGDVAAAAPALTVEGLVREVLARNPTLAQMGAAAEVVAARYPQVTSLDDPTFGATIAPAGLGSQGDGSRGYRIEVSQKFPWCGKLALRGQTARAEAAAAGNEVEDTRLQLIESAKSAFYDYYLVARAAEVNEETLQRLAQFKDDANALYRTPPKDRKVSFQDVVQADVEIGRQRERQLMLARMREVAVARINTLMHLPPDAPLAPPPAEITVDGSSPDGVALRAAALARRPDLQALANRIAAERASLGLAHKDYYPDVEVMAAYDGFWTEKPLQPQVGVRINLPVRYARREGAVAEARARLAQREAELARQIDRVNFEVQQAVAQVRESERTVRLYEKSILPDADLNVKTARADYKTGQVPAIGVVEAERTRLSLRDRYYEAVADYFRRLAALERAAGGPLAAPTTGVSP
jgi:cobalt-zinc-cadmium efflux system outer membrane protein